MTLPARRPLIATPGLVRARAEADEWRDAVRTATTLLVDAGLVTPRYPGKVISVIERYGPYTVIAPGLALVHAQPSPDTLTAGTAAAAFPAGVHFGHAHFDPVGLVIAVATTNPAQHIELIAEIAAQLERSAGLVGRAVRAASDDELHAVMSEITVELD